MNVYKSGQAATSVFSLATEDDVLVVRAARRRVRDEEGTLIADWTPLEGLPVPADSEELAVQTPAALNTLLPGTLRAIRVVEVEFTLADGTVLTRELAHQIEATQLLVAGINSFQTYYQAVLGAQLYADATLPGWVGNDNMDVRTRALTEAFERIRLLPIVIEWESNQSIIRDRFFDPPRLRDLNLEQILRLEPRLTKALRQAQILEADAILTDDPIARFRAAGIQSMTTGESSQFFGSSRPVDRGVCAPAAKVLARWIRDTTRIGRA